jgi:hypothetical protein
LSDWESADSIEESSANIKLGCMFWAPQKMSF